MLSLLAVIMYYLLIHMFFIYIYHIFYLCMSYLCNLNMHLVKKLA
jgi:hypothetical protein